MSEKYTTIDGQEFDVTPDALREIANSTQRVNRKLIEELSGAIAQNKMLIKAGDNLKTEILIMAHALNRLPRAYMSKVEDWEAAKNG
jgi:hypothetical protein